MAEKEPGRLKRALQDRQRKALEKVGRGALWASQKGTGLTALGVSFHSNYDVALKDSVVGLVTQHNAPAVIEPLQHAVTANPEAAVATALLTTAYVVAKGWRRRIAH